MSAAGRIKYFITFFLCLVTGLIRAQQADSLLPPPDTSRSVFVETIQKLAALENASSIRHYREGKMSIAQRNTIDAIKALSQHVKLYMKNGLDTLDIVHELDKTKQCLLIAKDGIVTNKGTTQTQRNLYVTAKILSELMDQTAEQKQVLDKYAVTLAGYKDVLDSLSSDSSLYTFPSDSVSIIRYAKRILVVNKEIGPVDSSLKIAVGSAQELQLRVDMMLYELRSFSEDIELYRANIAAKVLSRELQDIWAPVGYSRPLSEILNFSKAKEKMVLGFYIKENLGRIFIILILIGCGTFFARSVSKLMSQEDLLDPEFKGQLVLKYPFLSSAFIVLNLFQFIFISPPFIFSFCFWCASIVCLTVIFREILARFWLKFWYISIVFFLLTAAQNFLLQASREERWFMLLLSVSGVVLIVSIFYKHHIRELRERGLRYFIIFVAVVETAASFFNMFGRYNIAKSFLITGYIGIVIAILFFWTIRLINEMLGMTFRVYKFPDRRMFYINFDKVGTRVPPLFYVILVIGWFIEVGRNFYAFKEISEPIENFLTHTRTIGEFTFSISSIVIFLGILVLSMLLSRIISFFASAPPSPHGTQKGDRIGIGSWLLLVRIFILTLGILFAFAATGIPVDKLTIILGALSVGIGLGMQSLVTNLVSGLIIAFEKPVNVGDFLEVNGKMATMKSIGFRSSIARLSNGAHVVIPNGDVLNQHLVNWSMGRNMMRVSILVGVAYGTDLDKAKHLLQHLISSNERILKNPSGAVYVKEFGESAVSFELLFWAGHLAEADSLRSEVITQINRQFKEAGIIIPFPQQDINITSVPVPKKEEQSTNNTGLQ